MRDVIIQVARELELDQRSGGRAQAKLEDFVRTFRSWKDSATPAVDNARAFELGWLIIYTYTVANQRPATRFPEIEFHAGELGLQLPSSWQESIQGEDWNALQNLTDSLGGQLMARRRHIVPYYQAGLNTVVSVANNDEPGLDDIISELKLPDGIVHTGDEMRARADSVHQYFLSILHGS
jgi:hypothetical protein